MQVTKNCGLWGCDLDLCEYVYMYSNEGIGYFILLLVLYVFNVLNIYNIIYNN